MGKKVPKHYEQAFTLPPLRAMPNYTRHFSKRVFPDQEWEGQGRRSGWGALLKQKLPLSVNISGGQQILLIMMAVQLLQLSLW